MPEVRRLLYRLAPCVSLVQHFQPLGQGLKNTAPAASPRRARGVFSLPDISISQTMTKNAGRSSLAPYMISWGLFVLVFAYGKHIGKSPAFHWPVLRRPAQAGFAHDQVAESALCGLQINWPLHDVQQKQVKII